MSVSYSSLLTPQQKDCAIPHQKESAYRPDNPQNEGHEGNG